MAGRSADEYGGDEDADAKRTRNEWIDSMKPIASIGRNQTVGPHPEEAALLSLSKDARPSRRMAAGTFSLVAALRDARKSALLRTRLMDKIDSIRCKRFAADDRLPPIRRPRGTG